MKSQRFVLIMLFIWHSIIIFNQAYSQQILDYANYGFYYELIWQFDTLQNNHTREDMIILQVGRNVSKSYSYFTFQADSLMGTSDGEEVRRIHIRRAIQVSIRKGDSPQMAYYRRMGAKVYKDYTRRTMTVTDNINEDYYMYSDELDAQNWRILDSTNIVLDYHCQMAVADFRGRSWIAWFTHDIPISDGPWKFSGLPGLIMEVYDSEKHFHFSLVGMEQMDNEPIVFSPVILGYRSYGNYEETTRIDFLRGMNWYLNNHSVIMNAKLGIKLYDESVPVSRQHNFMERDYR